MQALEPTSDAAEFRIVQCADRRYQTYQIQGVFKADGTIGKQRCQKHADNSWSGWYDSFKTGDGRSTHHVAGLNDNDSTNNWVCSDGPWKVKHWTYGNDGIYNKEGGCSDTKGELFVREGPPVFTNMASPAINPERTGANDQGFQSNNLGTMTDGAITENQGAYKAYFKKSNQPARYGINMGSVKTCNSMRFHSTTTNARPRTFRVQYTSADSSTESDWTTVTLSGPLDKTETVTGDRAVASNNDLWHGVYFPAASAQFWAAQFVDDVHNNGNDNAGLDEIEFYCV